MSPGNERDHLSDLLSVVELPGGNPAQREAIYARTCGVLRRRRVMRRCLWIVSLAACYVVGGLSVLAWQSARRENQLAGQPGGRIDIRNPTPADQPGPSAPVERDPSKSGQSPDAAPAVMTRSEASDFLSTFEKLRRAGDRQLNERGNLQGAIACYRRALDVASDDELKIVPLRDSWLLIPLKEARLETRKHDHKKS
jgi:hypothetical protein